MTLNVKAAPHLPHAQTMLFIDEIKVCEEENGTVVARIKDDCIFADADGRVNEMLVVELLAQGYAALEGYRASHSNKPVQKGLLVGVKKLVFDKTKIIKIGSVLEINLTLETELDAYTIVSGQVVTEGETIASANLTLYLLSEDNGS
ncbi:MAG: hypothetical protein OCC45_15910 [Desulfotalea sp.]